MTTILTSFDQALPDITAQMFGKQRNGPAHVSGSNTSNCKPPAAAFEIPVEHWIGKADQLCLTVQNHRTGLQRGYMPGNETAQLINSEEDVVNASALRFLHPVHTALSLVHPEDSYLCELIKGKDNTPGPTASLSRVDRMYFKGRPADWNHTGNSNNTMACLEFKRAKALDAQEFKNAIVTTSQAYQGRVDAATEDDDHYLLNEMNVSTILSQATNYAIKFNTTFVALFDYQTLILLVMTQVEKKKGYGGDFTYMTVVTDSTQLRKAFLGFLLCAHLHKDRNDSWQKARDGSDILTKASTLGNNTAGVGAGRLNKRPERAGAAKRTYAERDSQSGSQSSSQGMQDAARRAAKTSPGSVKPADARTPSGHAKTSSTLSNTSTSSAGSGTSTGSATTVSSAGSQGNSVKGHAAPAVAAPSGTKTASIPVRTRAEASNTETKHVAANKDAKVMNKDAKATAAKNKATPVTSR